MVYMKKQVHTLLSRVPSCLRFMYTGWGAWCLILLMIVLQGSPYLFPLDIATQIGLLAGLMLIVQVAAAFLRARRGALVVWVVDNTLMLCYYLFQPQSDIPGWQEHFVAVGLGMLVMGLIAGQLRVMSMRLKKAYSALEVAHATIQRQALTDGLTGLPNHRAIVEQLHKEMERARRYQRALSVLFFDADRFKRVNDTYGHAVGDAVLRQVGERAASVIHGGDTIGRFGGEEFVILLPEVEEEEAKELAERIRVAVAAEVVAATEVKGGIAATVSIGIASYPVDGENEQTLLSQADEAMYIAKRMGRNQVRTAEEARRIGEDAELMALLQETGQSEIAQREGATLEQLRQTYTIRMISSLLSLLERRGNDQNIHAHAVSDLATALAQKMGQTSEAVFRIGLAALLHDIGMVAMPDRFLQKGHLFTPQELALLKEHTVIGAQILESSPFLIDLAPAVRHHHEQWNGAGSPDQLSGKDIPLVARIIAVAEAYDALQREHSSQAEYSSEYALAEVQQGAGVQFDPEIVQLLAEVLVDQQELQVSGEYAKSRDKMDQIQKSFIAV